MFERRLRETIERDLAERPAVAMLGPRQSGKTTLAQRTAETRPSVDLDLESERDRARLAEPELDLPSLRDKLVVLDEVHRSPGLFPVLRGQIDEARRSGRRSGLYLMLGSAALDLLRQPGESLAGRVGDRSLGPLDATEVANDRLETLRVRGGFPESFLAADDARSLRWRQSFVRTYLERDIPQFGPRIPAETLRRFWAMLAHQQGRTLNVARLAANLDIDAKTANRSIDLPCDRMLVRRLPAWHANVGKRLVKSPKERGGRGGPPAGMAGGRPPGHRGEAQPEPEGQPGIPRGVPGPLARAALPRLPGHRALSGAGRPGGRPARDALSRREPRGRPRTGPGPDPQSTNGTSARRSGG
jgi:hypothetical protein